MALLLLSGVLTAVLFLCYHVSSVPANLRHLPHIPILPLLISYCKMEAEDVRIKKLILPFATQKKCGVVVVWALGRWTIHILDPKIGRKVLEDLAQYPKERPPDDLLLWRFIGNQNVLMRNGDAWKKHSTLINDAFNNTLPIEQFAALAEKAFRVIGNGESVVQWDNLAQRFALDAVGSTVLGHDFNALSTDSSLATDYNTVMHSIANPLYLIFPPLEHIIPRRSLVAKMDNVVKELTNMLNLKRESPGNDIMSFMLRDPEMSDEELRDNMVVLFIAGHDTSAGALSSLVYYLAMHPHYQERARSEVLSVLGPHSCPTANTLGATSLPFLNACIREAMRINTPISYIVPRTSSETTRVGQDVLPANTSLIVNIFAVHHNEDNWSDPFEYRPERFLDINWRKDVWQPFATGPRQCPARNFAMYEQRTLITMLLREYEWTLPRNSIHKEQLKNAFSPFALTLPYNLDIKFSKRPSSKVL
ncbi:hypothetical protein AMATHDRAFT_6456 [Amanita thiersii Skay4041]|uniref:Cytochrome P450 n=1 Tax=Amanita thiersii Skay4041 TaxID=703135 RepID=A0A2A9NJA7_9AGAR|nr:hypothetical protein AMATHDRAFT_6456 [Amanita thiersii Skay4041]